MSDQLDITFTNMENTKNTLIIKYSEYNKVSPYQFSKVIHKQNKTIIKTNFLWNVDTDYIYNSDNVIIKKCQFFTDLENTVQEWLKMNKNIQCLENTDK